MSVLERVHAAQSNNTSDSREGGLGQNSQLSQQRSDLKKKLVSQLGLSTISQLMKQGDIGYVREELTVACQEILNKNSFDAPELETSAQLIRQVVDEICGLGPIQPLLEDLEVTEIMINGCGSLFYEKNGEIREADAVFDSPEQILIVMDRILAPLGRRLDQVSPIVDARLANGDRVNAVAEPIAINGPAVTIRRFTGKITSLSRLIELGSLPPWLAQLLSWAEQSMPSDNSPRSLDFFIFTPPGSTAPCTATGTTCPSRTFVAPVTTVRASVPISRVQITSLSALGCGTIFVILPVMTFCISSPQYSTCSTGMPAMVKTSANS